MHHAEVADLYPSCIPRSQVTSVIGDLHKLFESRDLLGFTLFDRDGLSRLAAALEKHSKRQTPYIPPRIWKYQVSRLQSCLEDFQEHKRAIQDCYHFCLEAYQASVGDRSVRVSDRVPTSRLPFGSTRCNGTRTGFQHLGPFSLTAKRFGINRLLERWLLRTGESIDGGGKGLRLLGSYLTLVSYAGFAHILNFSLMRSDEAGELRTDAHTVEEDELFGSIHLLTGPTTKTIKDSDARWITAPSVSLAIDCMSCIAGLRAAAAQANPRVPPSLDPESSPRLMLRAYEPWGNAKLLDLSLDTRANLNTYANVLRIWPNLLDSEQLRITEADIRLARRVTPTLHSDQFEVGKLWPLAWHQLRRTGAVNMLASGVSDASLQYQLKHASRAMSLYYGQGYSALKLNDSARNEYIRTMYEVIGRELSDLFSDRFVSPHGQHHKSAILKLVDLRDDKALTAACKAGKVSWRHTLFGGCTRRGEVCPVGGIDNFVRCGGGDGEPPCPDAIYDREREPEIQRLNGVIDARLAGAPQGSPELESLQAQKRAIENVLNAIIP